MKLRGPIRFVIAVSACALSAAVTSKSSAAIVPVSQSRQISADARGSNVIGDSKSATATNFDPFKASVLANTSPMPNPSPPPNYLEGGGGSASASQNSAITSTAITASGDGSAIGGGLQGWSGGGSFSSFFDVVFDLTQPSNVTLTGSASWFDIYYPLATVYFDGPSGQLATLNYSFGDYSGKISYSGVLPAGQYKLHAAVSASGSEFNPQVGSYNVTLNAVALPEPSTFGLAALASGAVWLAICKRSRHPRRRS